MNEPTVETPEAPATLDSTPKTEALYFKKVMANFQFYINRVPVDFEQLATNLGVLKIGADDPKAAILTAAAAAKRGGIVKITEVEMEELKKKLPYKPLAPRFSKPKLQILQTDIPRKSKAAAGGNVADTERIFGRANGVGTAVGRGTGAFAGTPAPVPAHPITTAAPPGEFKPSTGDKAFKMPVTKKPTNRTVSNGSFELEPTG